MSDFDTVLERLLADPAFASALSADPAGALVGYRLTPDETVLLRSQVTGDIGGHSAVETRANQSSTFGLLTPLAGLAGAAEVFGQVTSAQQGFSAAGAQQGFGAPAAAQQGFGAAGAQQGFGAPAAAQGFGPAAGGAGGGGPVAAAMQGFGTAETAQGFGAAPQEGFGAAPGHGRHAAVEGFGPADPGRGAPAYTQGFGSGSAPPGLAGGLGDDLGRAVTDDRPPAPPQYDVPEDYRTRVDVDGDGTWDRHSLRGTRGGGVDILVDSNSDGRVDFIGHDTDADGLVDSARYDRNHDGFFERRSYDDNGDGWLDRHETRRPPAAPPDEGLIGRNLRLPEQG